MDDADPVWPLAVAVAVLAGGAAGAAAHAVGAAVRAVWLGRWRGPAARAGGWLARRRPTAGLRTGRRIRDATAAGVPAGPADVDRRPGTPDRDPGGGPVRAAPGADLAAAVAAPRRRRPGPGGAGRPGPFRAGPARWPAGRSCTPPWPRCGGRRWRSARRWAGTPGGGAARARRCSPTPWRPPSTCTTAGSPRRWGIRRRRTGRSTGPPRTRSTTSSTRAPARNPARNPARAIRGRSPAPAPSSRRSRRRTGPRSAGNASRPAARPRPAPSNTAVTRRRPADPVSTSTIVAGPNGPRRASASNRDRCVALGAAVPANASSAPRSISPQRKSPIALSASRRSARLTPGPVRFAGSSRQKDGVGSGQQAAGNSGTTGTSGTPDTRGAAARRPGAGR